MEEPVKPPIEPRVITQYPGMYFWRRNFGSVHDIYFKGFKGSAQPGAVGWVSGGLVHWSGQTSNIMWS